MKFKKNKVYSYIIPTPSVLNGWYSECQLNRYWTTKTFLRFYLGSLQRIHMYKFILGLIILFLIKSETPYTGETCDFLIHKFM